MPCPQERRCTSAPRPGTGSSPFGNGLRRVSFGVVDPSSVPLNGLLNELTKSLFGEIFQRTSFGSQKMPYPLRKTVFSVRRQASPNRGENRLPSLVLLRLGLSGVFTSPSLPVSFSPVGPESSLATPGTRTLRRSKRSDHGPICSKRIP